MSVKASDVKKLREMTGAGMMECKKALVESGGDSEKAAKILKELGLAAAAKRDGRATNEGRIFLKISPSKAIALEVTCETDFVAKNKDFIGVGEKLVNTVDEKEYTEINDDLLEIIKDIVAIIKENIKLKRFKVVEAGDDEILVNYEHGEGRIGVIVKLKTGKAELKDNAALKELAFNIALHIAAFAPKYLKKDEVEESFLKEQEEIFMKQAENLGKPENVIKGIVQGKIKKCLAEVCLLDQGFVKDDKQSVAKVLDAAGKEHGSKIEIIEYVYYKVGSDA